MLNLKSILLIMFAFISNSPTLMDCTSLRTRVDIENVSVCPENDKLHYPVKNLKYEKVNKTHSALSYDLTFEYDLDESSGVIIELERFSSGGWIKIPFIPRQKNICGTFLKMEILRQRWIQAMATMNVKNPEKCPIPKGQYSVKNLVINTDDLKFAGWTGKYRTIVKLTGPEFKDAMLCLLISFKISEVADKA